MHTNENRDGGDVTGGTNTFSGTAHGPVVQARDVYGDVYVGASRKAVYEPPHQIPPVTRLFENRRTELADLDTWLAGGPDPHPADAPATGPPEPEPAPIYVLHGPPGIGKSTLLKRWAARAAAPGRFPGGEFWVDFRALREQSAGGADVAEALAQCLRATGVDDTYLPGTLHELANAFRTRTAGNGVLLLLDEVSEPAQVRALLPNSPGSAVAIAGRSRLGELVTFDGASAYGLGPLDDMHALALLERLLGKSGRLAREPDAGALIIKACAGLPVAIQIAAARLAKSRPGQLVIELADERRRLAALSASPTQGDRTVSAVFSVAYSGLTAEGARLYRLLGLFPGQSVGIGTAVCVAGVDPQTADDLLDALEDSALLEWDEEDGRYRFHDLVRLHALERAMDEESEQERDAVLERCVDYYVTGAAFADLAVMGDRLRIGGEAARRPHAYDPFDGTDRRRAALAWLAAERTEALAVLRAAAEHGGMPHQVWQLAESLTALYLNHRHLGDWRVSCELGAEAAAADGEPAAEARLRALLSRPLLDLGEDARAREELDLALARAEESDHTLLRASVCEFDGRYWDRHDPQRALASYRRSLALNEEVPDNARGSAIARHFLGCALDATGERESALTELLGALEEFRALGDTRMAGRALSALGRVRQALGENEAAREAYEEAVGLLRENQSTHYEAQTLEAWAALDERQSEPEAAHQRLLRALEIYEAGGSPRAAQLRERLGLTDG